MVPRRARSRLPEKLHGGVHLPFSPDNPDRARNYVILILGCVALFATVMGAYVALAMAGKDTDAFMRFLTLLVVTLFPSALAALRANTAAHNTAKVVQKVDAVADTLNGGLDERLRQANRDTEKEVNGNNGRPSV